MDTAALVHQNGADLPGKRGVSTKTRLLTLDDLDQRTFAARRAAALIAQLEQTHGPDVAIEQRLRIIDLAVLNAMTEDRATRYFLGEPVDVVEFATLVNAKRRCLDAL